MARTIDYYFAVYSPWSFLGHGLFMDIASRRGLKVRFRPTPLLELFKETGGQPLSQRPPARQRYRWMELQRWRDKRGIDITFKPKFWPYHGALPDRCVIALTLEERNPDPFLRRAYAALWQEDQNVGDASVVANLLREAGENAALIIERAESPMVEALYAENRNHALAAGVFGAPSYVLDGEVFWGQDRLELLDDALAVGRKPYLPL
jgi:2-hydroxychromene-2-carboxylate isomerase